MPNPVSQAVRLSSSFSGMYSMLTSTYRFSYQVQTPSICVSMICPSAPLSMFQYAGVHKDKLVSHPGKSIEGLRLPTRNRCPLVIGLNVAVQLHKFPVTIALTLAS
jgi:hypothetical protein